ncbi:class II glutamine amidotransferase [Microbacterium sp. 4R-513]|uniref:class II glutamine amidotransferase n=1 Tax=Microbacterium sp. 4R-513 TaxID=2567934 RepID=UPI0013E1F17F|nr:class II glutamine amidotransferase [Microbacterium sp. 4R-513]QIG40397.1 class II glutamine amidotransferase [Microbacterium sp. 4R-513]
MCRWLAYAGEAIQPSKLILETRHSLVAQALDSPLGFETVNGDGFGFGWYPKDAAPDAPPATFHSIEPAWHDENLREIAGAVESPLFFAHVRAAAGPPIQQTNCHPFRHGRWLFMHNGGLAHFARMRRDLMLEIDPELFPLVRGTTDSEVLFHLAITHGLEQDPVRGLGRAVRRVEEVGAELGIPDPVQGTFAVSDGRTLWAFRYSTAHRSRTLFHSVDVATLREMYPDLERLNRLGAKGRVVVSEPLSDLPGAFIEVPESTVTILDGDDFRMEPFLAG